jgi:hypothetical protein
MHTKVGWKVELESITTTSFYDSIRTILKWSNIPTWTFESILLSVKTKSISSREVAKEIILVML